MKRKRDFSSERPNDSALNANNSMSPDERLKKFLQSLPTVYETSEISQEMATDWNETFSDVQKFRTCFNTFRILQFMASILPVHTRMIFEMVLSDPDEFKRIGGETSCWKSIDWKLFEKTFDTPINMLTKKALACFDDFKLIFPGSWNLYEFSKTFPNHADSLRKMAIINCDKFKQHFIQTHEHRDIRYRDNLNSTINFFPLPPHLSSEPRTQNIDTLEKFAYESINKYKNWRANKAGIIIATYMLKELHKLHQLFQLLPKELLVTIAAFTTNKNMHSVEEAQIIANNTANNIIGM